MLKNLFQLKKKNNSDLIEIHNRPSYLNLLVKNLISKNYILYFHNDPLSMSGSISVKDIFLLKHCYRIIF